jgi:protein-disulfide isomerase
MAPFIRRRDCTSRDNGAAMTVTSRLRSARFAWRAALDIGATIAMMSAAGVVIWSTLSGPRAAIATRPSISLPTSPLKLDTLAILGSPKAPVVLVIFSDFECPFCATFASETLPTLKRRYVDTGKVQLGFRHLPLPFHARAARAAQSAECAKRQGRFWEMHDALFNPPMRIAETDLVLHARATALDLDAFARCMSDGTVDQLTGDSAVAKELGVTGTPSFIVGVARDHEGVRAVDAIVGAQSLAAFTEVLDRALMASRTQPNASR